MKKAKNILVVGGGTAGWMAATTLQHSIGDSCVITLVESSDVPIIGVGEGSTPYLKTYFDHLGITESEWMPECDATYKAGILFPNWSTQPGYEQYFHPFFSQLDLKPAELYFYNCNRRRRGEDVPVLPEDYFISGHIVDQNLSPVPNQPLPFNVDYGYHFDSGKLGDFLKRRAIKRGVKHIIDHVIDIHLDSADAIAGVELKEQGIHQADFYIDCTGFEGLLIDKALHTQFHSYQDVLLNDSAVAIQTPRLDHDPMPAQTVSQAMKCGWSWRIPLTSRWGNGYVYSSQYISDDDAESELKEMLGVIDQDVKVKRLKIKIGRVKQHWHKNCLAVGLAQGFIEPLEATALMLIQFTLTGFVDVYRTSGLDDSEKIASFNSQINNTFDGVKDYILTHYLLNTRDDTPYWRAARNVKNIPHRLQSLIATWDNGGDFDFELAQHKDQLIYLRPSWYCLLSGMGRFNKPVKQSNQPSRINEVKQHSAQVASHYFSPHIQQLALLKNSH